MTIEENLTEIELDELNEHKWYLSEKAGQDVGIEYATADWLLYKRKKREEKKEEMYSQLAEILKHKWILSEKAGYDVGESAILDWINNYAKQWRKWKESTR